jgi:protein-S-isoprenylcysteine O-methyltransferase Ste14
MVRVLCLAAFVSCVASFVWAMSGRFFRKVEDFGAGFRLIQACGAFAAAMNLRTLVVHTPISGLQELAALALYGIALTEFWWAIATHGRRPPTHAFSSDEPVRLVREGPYRAVRHPFYSSYLITWSAALIATHDLMLLVPLCLMGAIYWRAARLEERKFEASPLSAQYSVYRTRTGMFLPWM